MMNMQLIVNDTSTSLILLYKISGGSESPMFP